jgi:hypothetical protein
MGPRKRERCGVFAGLCVTRAKVKRVAPTVFRSGKYRGFFFSREEARMHVHVASPDGEAKFWLEPILSLATHTGVTARELKNMQRLVEEHHEEIIRAWRAHFGG